MGGAHEREAKQKRNKEEQSEAIKKNQGKEKYVKNAWHSQTGIFLADPYAQRENQNRKEKSFCHAFFKKRAGVGRAHGREAKQNRNKEEESEAIKKKKGCQRQPKMRSVRSCLKTAELFTQIEISKTKRRQTKEKQAAQKNSL